VVEGLRDMQSYPQCPSPAKPAKEADSKPKPNAIPGPSRTSWIPIPAGPDSDGLPYEQGRIRNVNNLRSPVRSQWFSLLAHFSCDVLFKFPAFSARSRITWTHSSRPCGVDVSIAKRRGHERILVHVGKARKETHEGLHTRTRAAYRLLCQVVRL